MKKIFQLSSTENININLAEILNSSSFLYYLALSTISTSEDPFRIQESLVSGLQHDHRVQAFLKAKHSHLDSNPEADLNPLGILNNKHIRKHIPILELDRATINQSILGSIKLAMDQPVESDFDSILRSYELYQRIFSKTDFFQIHSVNSPVISEAVFNSILNSAQSQDYLNIYTIFCPDFSYKVLDSNTFKFTFEDINSGIGIIAQRGVELLEHIVYSILDADIQINLHANYASYECHPSGHNLNPSTSINFTDFEQRLLSSASTLERLFPIICSELKAEFGTTHSDQSLLSNEDFHEQLSKCNHFDINESTLESLMQKRERLYDTKLGECRSIQQTKDYIRHELKQYILAQEIHKSISSSTILFTSDNPDLNIAAAEITRCPIINGYTSKALSY